jgi:hypothetical protein
MRTADYFTCQYAESGEKNIVIGCITSKRNESKFWDSSFCNDPNNENPYCTLQKTYKIQVFEAYQ